jgi:hypothetical protein
LENALGCDLAIQKERLSMSVNFFSENVDKWGASEWFNRLADAIRQQDAAIVAGDKIAFEICRNVAASSAMRLVRDYEHEVRAALTRIRELDAREGQLPETLPDVGYEMLSTLRGHFTGPEHAESGRRAYVRLRAALSSKDQEKTNG